MKQVFLKLDEQTIKQLKIYSIENNIKSLNQLLNIAINEYINKHLKETK